MNTEKLIHRVYSSQSLRLALHFIFWMGLCLVQWWLTSISFNPINNASSKDILLLSFAGVACLAVFYYPFVYFILPRFFYRKKWLSGILMTFALVIIYTLLGDMMEQLLLKTCDTCMEVMKKNNSGYYEFLQKDILSRMQGKILSGGVFIGLFFSLCIPLSIKMALSSYRQQIRSLRLAKENAELEFNFLKSQINPHFLFNSLNNIYGLILNDEKEKSARIVARLSEFLRYSLYDWTQDEIPVEKEIQLLKDYIELESIRLNHTKVTFRHETDGSATKIASLLMIPIIENAFKYSPDNESSFINIELHIKSKGLHFNIQNSVDPDRQLKSNGGIGLTNFTKRLELYYPYKYNYTVENNDAVYSANLNIDLIWT